MKTNEKTNEPELDKGAIHETILNLIQNEPRGLLLDAGAGSGALSLRLSRLGFRVVSVDIAKNFKAKEFDNNLEFILCDLDMDVPFKNGTFDYVVSSEVIEHLENPWHFLRELSRIMKTSGKLYLTTPNVHSIHQRLYFLFSKPFYFFNDGDFKHNRHLNPMLFWNLKRMLSLAGFEIIKVTFNRAFIPKIRIRCPKTFLFGENLIVVAKKINEPGRWR